MSPKRRSRFFEEGDRPRPAHPCRMALGALLIQRRLKCSDEWLVKHIGENLVSVILHRNEGIWAVSLRGVHAGSVSEMVQRRGHGGDPGSIHSPAGGGSHTPEAKRHVHGETEYEVILVDATESPIERPKKAKAILLGKEKSGTR